MWKMMNDTKSRENLYRGIKGSMEGDLRNIMFTSVTKLFLLGNKPASGFGGDRYCLDQTFYSA